MKRIPLLFLIMIMVFTSAVPAFAAGSSEVPVTATILSEIEPIDITVGTSITATNASEDPMLLEYAPITIENKGAPVALSSVKLSTEEGWTLTQDADSTEFSEKAEKNFSMVVKLGNDTEGYDMSKGEYAPERKIGRNESLNVNLSGHFSPAKGPISIKGAKLTLTLSRYHTALKITGTNVTFKVTNPEFIEGNENKCLEYSNNGVNWNVYNAGNTINAIDNKPLYIRGTGITTLYNCIFEIGGSNVALSGNIEALLDYATVEAGGLPTVGENTFSYLFKENYGIVDASKLELPRTDLSATTSFYQGMFDSCISLESAPELPASCLGAGCYAGMFIACISLKSAPTLPVTDLADSCYAGMFQACTSLEVAPTLPATSLERGCYSHMFDECTSLEAAPALPAATAAEWCYADMFYGCTSLTSIPALPATTLGQFCYIDMFNGCTGIKISQTEDSTYTNAYRIPTSANATYSSVENPAENMFGDTGGTFTGTPELNTVYYTANEIVS